MSTQDIHALPGAAEPAGVGVPLRFHDGVAPGEAFRVPNGFHVHQLPSIDAERATVYRNWSRVAGMRSAAHVLILDSDTNVLDIFGQLLNGDGYNATLTLSALRSEDIHRLRPDVIVADASLATEGGVASFVHRIREAGDASVPTVVLCTSNPGFARSWTIDGVHILLKPFDLDEAMELIAHATG